MLTKTKLRNQIDKLPEEFSIDELIEQLILIEKIDKADKQSMNDEIISEVELDKEVKTWFE